MDYNTFPWQYYIIQWTQIDMEPGGNNVPVEWYLLVSLKKYAKNICGGYDENLF